MVDVVRKRLTDEGFRVDWRGADHDDLTDGLLTLTWQGQEHRFPVVIKSNLTPGAVALLPPVAGGVVLTREVTSGTREALTGAGWGYADGAGSVALSAPGLVVRLDGRRPVREALSIDRPFSKTGLPVTFVLLVRGSVESAGTQREIAALAGASLGTTNRVLKGLRELGYLSENGRLLKQQAMVDRWTESYLALSSSDEFSRHSYSSRVWTSPSEVLPGIAGLPAGVYLGSELAAWAKGASIRPQSALLYCTASVRKQVIVSGQLTPDPDGWVQLRETFWGDDLLPRDPRFVPDVLIRADLLAKADPRLTAVAKGLL